MLLIKNLKEELKAKIEEEKSLLSGEKILVSLSALEKEIGQIEKSLATHINLETYTSDVSKIPEGVDQIIIDSGRIVKDEKHMLTLKEVKDDTLANDAGGVLQRFLAKEQYQLVFKERKETQRVCISLKGESLWAPRIHFQVDIHTQVEIFLDMESPQDKNNFIYPHFYFDLKENANCKVFAVYRGGGMREFIRSEQAEKSKFMMVTISQASWHKRDVKCSSQSLTETNFSTVGLVREGKNIEEKVLFDQQKKVAEVKQVVRFIVKDDAYGKISSRVKIAKGAEQVHTEQDLKVMLFGDTACAEANPELEVYNDDVSCTHGAAIGRIEDELLFYLQSRGIDTEEAQALLLHSFLSESFCFDISKKAKVFLESSLKDFFR